jgi:integrase
MARATGYVRTIDRREGPVFYAKLKLPDGSQPQRRLGRVWDKRTRPPAGYVTAGMAQARLEAILCGDDPLVNIAPSRVTFQRACDEWIADRERECRASTMHDYKGTVKGRLVPFVGASTPIEDVTTATVNELRDAMLDEGLSGRTVNKTLVLLHGVFKLAQERHELVANPVALARRAKQRGRKLEQYLTPPEVMALVRHAPTAQEAVLYEVAAWTGLRWGELRALRWADVDFAGGYINVNRNWPAHGVEGDTKSGKPRAVPLWDQAAAVLDKLSRREHFTELDDYVFCNDVGGALGYDWTTLRFKVARDAAKLTSPRPNDRKLTFHDLRHSYGTLAARFYGNLRDVQEYMGHASVTTTEIYAHFVPRVDAAARGTAALTEALSGARSVHESTTVDTEPAELQAV